MKKCSICKDCKYCDFKFSNKDDGHNIFYCYECKKHGVLGDTFTELLENAEFEIECKCKYHT